MGGQTEGCKPTGKVEWLPEVSIGPVLRRGSQKTSRNDLAVQVPPKFFCVVQGGLLCVLKKQAVK